MMGWAFPEEKIRWGKKNILYTPVENFKGKSDTP